MKKPNGNDSVKVHVMYIREMLENHSERFDKIDRKLDNDYVTKDEFEPIKKGFYGILTAMISAAIAGVAILFGMKQ